MIARLARVVGALLIAVVLVGAHLWLAAAVYAVVLAANFGWHLAFRPFVNCITCKGAGTSKPSWLFPNAKGLCWRCHGRRQYVRASVKILTPERGKRLIQQYNTGETVTRKVPLP